MASDETKYTLDQLLLVSMGALTLGGLVATTGIFIAGHPSTPQTVQTAQPAAAQPQSPSSGPGWHRLEDTSVIAYTVPGGCLYSYGSGRPITFVGHPCREERLPSRPPVPGIIRVSPGTITRTTCFEVAPPGPMELPAREVPCPR